MVLDVYELGYCLACKNDRGKFVEAFWNLVNCPELNKSIRDLLKIKFTPSREERYSFYFTKDVLFFSSHWEKGMEGVIEVVS